MALGKRRRQHQDTFWVAADKLGGGPRHAFYDRLNQLLDEIDFDRKLEKAAEPFYEKTGRKGLRAWRLLPDDLHRVFRGHLQPARNRVAVWGYHPLVITLAQTQKVLYLVNRSGNRPSHESSSFFSTW